MSAQINLFNPLLGKQKHVFSAKEMTQMLGLVLLGVAVITWYLDRQATQLEKQLASSKEQLNVAQGQLAKVTSEFVPRNKNKQLETEIVGIEAQVRALEKVTDLLKQGDFGNASGYSSYLRAFARQSVDGLWLTKVSVSAGGNELGLTGRALQAELVPRYVQRLAGEPVLHGKSFSSLEMQRLADSGSKPAVIGSGAVASGAVASGARPAPAALPPAALVQQTIAGEANQMALLNKLAANPALSQLVPLLKMPSPAAGTGGTAGAAAALAPGAAGASAAPAVPAVRPDLNAAASANSAVIEFSLSAHGSARERK